LARIPVSVPGSVQGPGGGSSPGRSRGMTMVTRGFGRNQNIVAQGFSLMSFISDAVLRFIELGQSGAKRALKEIQEVVVWVKLIRINDETLPQPIQGSVKVKLTDASQLAVRAVRKVSVKVRSIYDDIKISVNRIK
jgi:hypothetical protein